MPKFFGRLSRPEPALTGSAARDDLYAIYSQAIRACDGPFSREVFVGICAVIDKVLEERDAL